MIFTIAKSCLLGTLWLIPLIVSGLVRPNYKWINPLQKSHVNHWGYKPQKRFVGSSPPSTRFGIPFLNSLGCGCKKTVKRAPDS